MDWELIEVEEAHRAIRLWTARKWEKLFQYLTNRNMEVLFWEEA